MDSSTTQELIVKKSFISPLCIRVIQGERNRYIHIYKSTTMYSVCASIIYLHPSSPQTMKKGEKKREEVKVVVYISLFFRSHGPPNSLLFPLGQFTSLDQMGIYYICTFQSRRPSVPPSGLFPLHVAVFSSLLYGMKIFITIPPLVGRLLLLFRRRLIRTFNQPNRKKKTKCTPYFSFVFYFIFFVVVGTEGSLAQAC